MQKIDLEKIKQSAEELKETHTKKITMQEYATMFQVYCAKDKDGKVTAFDCEPDLEGDVWVTNIFINYYTDITGFISDADNHDYRELVIPLWEGDKGMEQKKKDKIMQLYNSWIGKGVTPEEEEFADDSEDQIIDLGFIGGYTSRDEEVKAEEKEKAEAVKEVIMYLFDDELHDYSENPSDNHIFLKLMKLKEMFGIDNIC